MVRLSVPIVERLRSAGIPECGRSLPSSGSSSRRTRSSRDAAPRAGRRAIRRASSSARSSWRRAPSNPRPTASEAARHIPRCPGRTRRREAPVRGARRPSRTAARAVAQVGSGAMTLNIFPRPPCGVQLASASLPPGSVTRASSRATASWSGANMIPNVEETLSKLPSSNGRFSASPTMYSMSRPCSAARSCAVSMSAGERSSPVTSAPAGRGALGDRARAAGDVEPAVTRCRGKGVDHTLVNVVERLGDALVGAVAPHDALSLL